MKYCELYFGSKTKMRTDNKDGDPDKEENFYIIKNTLSPAILSENGFFTNEAECKKMMTEEWQQAVADVHIKTFEEYAKLLKDL
jgi:N-acetylmuramoyl-L-alanine amidase